MKLIETRQDFKDWCEAKSCTKEELAISLGVTRQTIYNWLEGKRKNPITGEESPETKIQAASYDKLPQMLTLSIFALEQLGPNYLVAGNAMRKRTKQS
jgi:transcriptional regulator with XRE-family HTH domain